mgnify:CR=1 FL=1
MKDKKEKDVKSVTEEYSEDEFMRFWSASERRKRVRKANREVKGRHVRKKMTGMGRLLLCVLALVLLFVGIYFTYYYFHYVRYDEYLRYLSDYDYEQAKAYTVLDDTEVNVQGFDLVAESDYLKMYTDTKTANVAIYDKRNGETVYTNPLSADQDTVANEANINIMKSQFILYYYNGDVVSGSLFSYNHCVQNGNLSVESLENGIRYIYTISDGSYEFVIPLEYRIDEDYLEVSIPVDHIEERGDAYVYRIQLLRYMAAASDEEDGYMVVPNGSGSLIYFNNGKTEAPMYSQYIYDIDPLASNYTTVENVESARLPIYGICRESSSVLVSIEDSAANCVISAGVSGVFSEYNYAYPTFVLRITDNLRMFGDSTTDVYVMEPEAYDSNICVRYTMLTDEYEGYSGIANYYRERLIAEGALTNTLDNSDIPFYYDVITGVKETGHFMGVQYLHTFAMTTFSQAGEMSDYLYQMGITNQVLNLQGWFNGGYYHDAPDNISVLRILGGISGLENLNQTLLANGGRLYVDVAFQEVTYADKWFPYLVEASRYYGAGYVASFGLVDPTTLRNTSGLGYLENRYYLLSPKFLPRYVEAFEKEIQSIDVSGISLRDLGNLIPSDKKRTCMINREEALDIILGQYELLAQTGRYIMTNKANAYTFAYTDDILNAPLSSTKYEIIDETIPLYEMIIHGYIDYSSGLINFENADNRDVLILKLIETGASPHFVFTMESSNRMRLTALNRYYSTTFDTWKDISVEVYNRVNDALKNVSGAYIINHEIISDDVRRISYDNGVVIILNYSDEEITIDGKIIPACDYVINI